MKTISAILILTFFSCGSLYSQEVKKIGQEELQEMLASPADKLHVINFWATWCGPCVTEIPHFEKVAGEYSTDKVEFTLASLDFPSQYESRLLPFIKKHKLSLRVVMIEELDYDLWMKYVDPLWQGNIPATLLFNNARNQRLFISKALDETELRSAIDKML